MERDDDTNLLKLYEQLQKKIADVKGLRNPGGKTRDVFRSECEMELEYIEEGWNRVLFDRRRGILTDTGRIEEVERVAGDIAKFNEIPIRFLRNNSTQFNDDDFSPWWTLEMQYDGEREQLDIGKWWKLCDKISLEMKDMGFVDPKFVRGWGINPHKIPTNYHDLVFTPPAHEEAREEQDEEKDEEQEDYSLRIPIDPYMRPVAAWIIDTWIWNGPPKRRKKRRLG